MWGDRDSWDLPEGPGPARRLNRVSGCCLPARLPPPQAPWEKQQHPLPWAPVGVARSRHCLKPAFPRAVPAAQAQASARRPAHVRCTSFCEPGAAPTGPDGRKGEPQTQDTPRRVSRTSRATLRAPAAPPRTHDQAAPGGEPGASTPPEGLPCSTKALRDTERHPGCARPQRLRHLARKPAGTQRTQGAARGHRAAPRFLSVVRVSWGPGPAPPL